VPYNPWTNSVFGYRLLLYGIWEYPTQLHSLPSAIKNLHSCKLPFKKISASRPSENMCVKSVLKYIFEMTIFLVPPVVIRTVLSYVVNWYCVLVLVILFWSFFIVSTAFHVSFCWEVSSCFIQFCISYCFYCLP
jgi:hypothetical protein